MNAACENNDGSFSCSCNEGYNGDGTNTCEGKQALYYTTWLNGRSHVLDTNECDSDPCTMNAACDNTDGSFSCSCFEGFNGNGIILCEGELTLLKFLVQY